MKAAWSVLRETYNRTRKRAVGASGASLAEVAIKWQYFESMKFLENGAMSLILRFEIRLDIETETDQWRKGPFNFRRLRDKRIALIACERLFDAYLIKGRLERRL